MACVVREVHIIKRFVQSFFNLQELKDKKEIRWEVYFSKQSKVGEKVSSKVFTTSHGQNITKW